MTGGSGSVIKTSDTQGHQTVANTRDGVYLDRGATAASLTRFDIVPRDRTSPTYKLAEDARRRLARKIEALAEDPRPSDCKKLEGEDDLYRVRTGDYRIVYSIREERLVILVLVVGIGHRSDIYKALRRR
jgi:mRNA interferase RelE/StbE